VRKTYNPIGPKAAGGKSRKGKEKATSDPIGIACKQIEGYDGSAVAYLKRYGWSVDKFGHEYWMNSCFMENKALSFERNERIDGRRGQRLLVMSGLSWNVESQNKSRDYVNIIVAVTLETAIVEWYRETLIKECTGAGALRGELRDCFKTEVLPQLDSDTGQLEGDWEFPDNFSGIGDIPAPRSHSWNATLLKNELDSAKDANEVRRGSGGTRTSKKMGRSKDSGTAGSLPESSESVDAILNMVKLLEENVYLFCSDPGVAPGTLETTAHDHITALYEVRVDLIYGGDPGPGVGLHWARSDGDIEQGEDKTPKGQGHAVRHVSGDHPQDQKKGTLSFGGEIPEIRTCSDLRIRDSSGWA